MLLAEGASVGLFDVIPQEKGDAIAKELSSSGKALYVRVDITDDKAVGAAVQQVVDKYGNLKGCVHCAGIALKRDWTNDAAESIPNFKKASQITEELHRLGLRWQMLDVNVLGTFIVNAHVAPFWTSDEERGVIVNFASAAAQNYARCLAYGPTKTATIGITRCKLSPACV
jgi:NAD(P)-dependent dehydrogenase (short-subunit alcohol dehydrogenase family)